MLIHSKYSPELRDVIERPQDKFTVGVAAFLIVFLILIVVGGFIIKSPDMIVADVRVSSSNPPVILKAQSQGNIHFIKDSLPGFATSGEYLACVSNAANYRDVEILTEFLDKTDPFSLSVLSFDASKLSLGEVSTCFYDYKYSLQQYELLINQDNEYYSKLKLYNRRLECDKTDLKNIEQSLDNSVEQLQIKQRNYITDSVLYLNGAILEKEFYNSRLDLLNARRYVISGQSSIDDKLRSIYENDHQIRTLQQEYRNQIQMQNSQVEMTYKKLMTQIKNWESKYIIKTSSHGTVELANLISEGDFVTVGLPVFNIIHDDNRYYAVAMLPTAGAGKVKVGAKVNLKIDSFPYAEYGTLSGIVENISQNSIEKYYLVKISLPNGLVSTSGIRLFFAETLYGKAEIITADRRLISRVFNRIYELLSSKKLKDMEENRETQINF